MIILSLNCGHLAGSDKNESKSFNGIVVHEYLKANKIVKHSRQSLAGAPLFKDSPLNQQAVEG